MSLQHEAELYIKNSDIEKFKILIETIRKNCEIINVRMGPYNFDYNEALLSACTYGNIEIVKWIIETFPYYKYNYNAALHRAYSCGHILIAKWIIETLDSLCIDYLEYNNLLPTKKIISTD